MGISWKTFRAFVLTVLLIGFSTALGIAIWKHIEGLGIFSIVLGVLFFSFILFWECGLPESDKRLNNNVDKNLSRVANAARNPEFLKLLSVLVGRISSIESKLDRLEDKHEILQRAVLKLSGELTPPPEDQPRAKKNPFTGKMS